MSYATFEHNGKVAVCGLRSLTADTHEGHRFDALALPRMRLELAGTTIFGDLSRFPKVPANGDLPPLGSAACYATDVPWIALYEGVPADLKTARHATRSTIGG